MEEEFEDEDAMEAEEEEDLFGGAASDAALSPSDRAAQRTEMVRQIAQTSRLYPRERKQEAPAIRKGTLRKIVQRSESAEELEGLKDVLRAWRVLGKNVTEMAANEIIGKFPEMICGRSADIRQRRAARQDERTSLLSWRRTEYNVSLPL